MSFLQPLMLFGLGLALLPIIIHLIHLMRRKKIRWAAMMWLMAAQRMNKGFSRLRQYLILAARVLAIAALIFVIGRPLAGGLLGLTGGAPDSVLILLDRSASMEQQLLTTGLSKRQAGLRNLTAAIKDAYGKRSRLVLIDSATLQPVLVENAEALPELPQCAATESAADIPAMLQAGLDYITTNQTGRTDVWLLSDLRQSDWNANGGRWAALRGAYATLPAVRFQVLAYPEAQTGEISLSIENVSRRETADKAELLLDIRLQRQEASAEPTTVPLRVVVNGVGSTIPAELKGNQALLQAQAIPLDKSTKRGWGRVELPADTSPADNVFHFVFDAPPPLKSVIVSDRAEVSAPLLAALQAPSDPSRAYESSVLTTARAAEIAWEETALIIWQAPLPEANSALAKQLDAQIRAGRGLIFLPPDSPTSDSFVGLKWTHWEEAAASQPVPTDWWRSDSGLLAATRAGPALPVGEVTLQRWCGLEGESIPLARTGDLAGQAPLLVRALPEGMQTAYFLTTWPGPSASSLARDGVVLYALLHRALNEGANALGNAQQRLTGPKALGEDPGLWQRATQDAPTLLASEKPLRAGVYQRKSQVPEKPDSLAALNRPPGEDSPQVLARSQLDELFAGLQWRLLERTLEKDKSLTSEVWRTFLMAMAVALVLEALLCMPSKHEAARLKELRT